ncbi:MAG: type II secretion system minor pseudopilin GspJ [Thioalkalispiraceae bacterium]|jgi:general secretion pathway protein J
MIKTRLPVTNKHAGFTLFELLVAVAIFGIVSYMAYTGLMQVMNAREHTGNVEKRLAEIQITFLHIERDLQHIVPRPIRDGYGTVKGELIGDELADYRLTLTRGGRHVPNDLPKSNLQRVGYLLEDETLYRISWPVLDQAQDTEPRRTKILSAVENVEIRFLNDKGEWETSWDSVGTPLGQQQLVTLGIPRAVAVKISLKDYGDINRMFLLTEA